MGNKFQKEKMLKYFQKSEEREDTKYKNKIRLVSKTDSAIVFYLHDTFKIQFRSETFHKITEKKIVCMYCWVYLASS